MEQEITLGRGFILRGNHDYTILKTLNRGGFGITYLAEAEFMDHHIPVSASYAIKEFFPSGLCCRSESQTVVPLDGKKSSYKESYDEFKAEADCLYGLHHPGIVPVNEVIEANGTVYYVMKFLKGKSLEDWVAEKGGRLSEADAVDILTKVADAVSYLHGQYILHLDVKPDNIMMTDSGPVLIDFGSFRRFKPNGSLETKKISRCVSDGFSPQEQYSGIERFTPQSDVYALGATLFYMLTGMAPIDSEQISNIWVYKNLPESVSEQTADAIVDAMAKNVDDRTPSVSDMISTLWGYKGAQDRQKKKGRTRRIEDINRRKTEEKKKILKIVAVVAAAIAAFLLPFFLLKPSSEPTPRHDVSSFTSADKETFTVNGVQFTMVRVDGGTFKMGADTSKDSDANYWESPVHEVTLSTYMIGETEVTQALWQAVMGSNPSNFTGDQTRPVEQVSWDDCQDFVKKLNSLTGRQFRLPTEAEWEYAARGGNKSRGYKYSGSNSIDDVAWYTINSNSQTYPVGKKRPNELGLYDMTGNVLEWCSDWFEEYSSSSQTNPKGAGSGSDRVDRGGSFYDYAGNCRSSYRGSCMPGGRVYDVGFRLAL